MITVKDLKEKLATLDDDMEVAVCGNNGLGLVLESVKVKRKGYIYDDGVTDDVADVLELNIDTYLAEPKDMGYMDLYVDEDDYENFINDNEEECEFDCE